MLSSRLTRCSVPATLHRRHTLHCGTSEHTHNDSEIWHVSTPLDHRVSWRGKNSFVCEGDLLIGSHCAQNKCSDDETSLSYCQLHVPRRLFVCSTLTIGSQLNRCGCVLWFSHHIRINCCRHFYFRCVCVCICAALLNNWFKSGGDDVLPHIFIHTTATYDCDGNTWIQNIFESFYSPFRVAVGCGICIFESHSLNTQIIIIYYHLSAFTGATYNIESHLYICENLLTDTQSISFINS